MSTNIHRRVWQRYTKLLQNRPLQTKAITASAIMTMSDAIWQGYERNVAFSLIDKHDIGKGSTSCNTELSRVNLQNGCPTNVSCRSCSVAETEKALLHDWDRSKHVAITGLTLSGPISHAWYNALERIANLARLVPKSLLGVAVRMTFDAFLFTPIAVALYFVWRSALEGKALDGIVEKLQLKWYTATLASWQFWPFANAVSFALVPIPLRVLYNNVLSLIWNGYLSFLNGQRLEDVVEERILHPEYFEKPDSDTKGTRPTVAERKAHEITCVCPHCRADRG